MESSVKKSVCAKLKTIPDLWFYKTSDRFTSGVPDILGCYQGKFFAIELKDPDKPSKTHHKLQLFIINEIKKAGGIAGVCTSTKEVLELLQITSL